MGMGPRRRVKRHEHEEEEERFPIVVAEKLIDASKGNSLSLLQVKHHFPALDIYWTSSVECCPKSSHDFALENEVVFVTGLVGQVKIRTSHSSDNGGGNLGSSASK